MMTNSDVARALPPGLRMLFAPVFQLSSFATEFSPHKMFYGANHSRPDNQAEG
jgi:hypothetical protein